MNVSTINHYVKRKGGWWLMQTSLGRKWMRQHLSLLVFAQSRQSEEGSRYFSSLCRLNIFLCSYQSHLYWIFSLGKCFVLPEIIHRQPYLFVHVSAPFVYNVGVGVWCLHHNGYVGEGSWILFCLSSPQCIALASFLPTHHDFAERKVPWVKCCKVARQWEDLGVLAHTHLLK